MYHLTDQRPSSENSLLVCCREAELKERKLNFLFEIFSKAESRKLWKHVISFVIIILTKKNLVFGYIQFIKSNLVVCPKFMLRYNLTGIKITRPNLSVAWHPRTYEIYYSC